MDNMTVLLSKLDNLIAICDSWEESQHPRDNYGQFATSGSSGRSIRLSENEKSALSSYSGDDFLRINKELRAGRSGDPMVKRIDTAIEKSSLPSGTVYRGMTREAARKLFPGGEVKPGQTISDKAFLSTSKSYGTATARALGGVILKIDVADGSKGIDMESHARDKSESEVLLPRDAKLFVVGIRHEKDKPGSPVIVHVKYGG